MISLRLPALIFALASLIFLVAAQQGFTQGLDFKDKDLVHRKYNDQRLDGADFSGATLRDTSFYRASLKGVNFQDADLRNTEFTGADLTGADFRNSIGPFISTGETNFSRTNFEGLDMHGITLYQANFRGANLKNTRGWGRVTNCSFRGADLRGANLMSAKAYSAEGMFVGAVYDENTRWPAWVDVEQSGARRAAP